MHYKTLTFYQQLQKLSLGPYIVCCFAFFKNFTLFLIEQVQRSLPLVSSSWMVPFFYRLPSSHLCVCIPVRQTTTYANVHRQLEGDDGMHVWWDHGTSRPMEGDQWILHEVMNECSLTRKSRKQRTATQRLHI